MEKDVHLNATNGPRDAAKLIREWVLGLNSMLFKVFDRIFIHLNRMAKRRIFRPHPRLRECAVDCAVV